MNVLGSIFIIILLTTISLTNESLAEGLEPSLPADTFYRDAVTGMEFVFIKGGCFEMGDTFGDGYFAERPVHDVCVDDFYVGKYEVTQAEWQAIMDHESSYPNLGDRFPAGCVNQDDVQAFMVQFSRRSGKKYRLPTEAEWEYACRSGGKRERYSGFDEKDHIFRYANFCDVNCNYDWVTGDQDDGNKDSAPVGTYRSNNLGLFDMSGNVWEWVSDWFDEGYYERSPRNNPKGPQSGQDRVVRGGCWLNSPNYLRCSYRFGLNPTLREKDVGFRVVLEK